LNENQGQQGKQDKALENREGEGGANSEC
jgi:hypothetical protein